jgi:hypothetical protein
VSSLPYHRAWDCRAGCDASPQHRGYPHFWVEGLSSFSSSGIGPLHSSGHTRTKGSSVTSPRALCQKENSSNQLGSAQAEGLLESISLSLGVTWHTQAGWVLWGKQDTGASHWQGQGGDLWHSLVLPSLLHLGKHAGCRSGAPGKR